MKKHLVLIILISVFAILAIILIIMARGGRLTNFAAGGSATLSLSPASGNYTVGSTMPPINIILNTGGQGASGAQAVINYNKNDLQVVDADSLATGTQISAGTIFPQVLYNNVDTANGKITFMASLNGGDPAYNNSAGVLASITFRVLQRNPSSAVTFDYIDGGTTGSKVSGTTGGTRILGGVVNASYNLLPPDISTTVTIQLESHPSDSSSTNSILEVRPAGQGTLAFQKTDLSTNTSGSGTLTISGLNSGNYDFRIFVNHYLSKTLANQALVGPLTLAFGTLKAGDLFADNQINGGDFTYLKQKIMTNDPVADIDKSGQVDVDDFSFIYGNWGQNGQ